jgi:hypothetical protein
MVLTNIFVELQLNYIFKKRGSISFKDQDIPTYKYLHLKMNFYEIQGFLSGLLCQIPKDPLLSQCFLTFQIKPFCSEPDKGDISNQKNGFIIIF